MKFDPFNNKGTSRVFYKLLSGLNTTKEISSSLMVRPPSVTEHLRRLQEIGIVQTGKKKGKFQEYEINPRKFLDLFIQRAIREKATHPSSIYPEEIKMLQSLRNNELFKDFVFKYLCQNQTVSVNELAKEFEDGLLHSSTLDRKRIFVNSEKQQFFEMLQKWKKVAKKKMTFVELNFQDALAKTLTSETFRV